jgi:hypothetical protein
MQARWDKKIRALESSLCISTFHRFEAEFLGFADREEARWKCPKIRIVQRARSSRISRIKAGTPAWEGNSDTEIKIETSRI